MRKALLDTDILSEFLKGHDATVSKAGQRYAAIHKRFTFTSVTVFEIVRGLEQKSAHSQVKRVLDWLSRNEEVVPEASDYLSAARLVARARLRGNVVELPDCLIASVAARLGLPLVTGNTSDYLAIAAVGLPLRLENWREP